MMRRFRVTDLFFSLALMAFIGPAVKYINIIFTTTTRWAFLAGLVGLLLIKGRLFMSIQRSRLGLLIFIYILWCLLTTLWSEVSILSFYKSSALFLVALSFVAAGRMWVHSRGEEQAFNYQIPIFLLVLLAGIAGQWHSGNVVLLQRGVVLYQGLAGNPNMFGSMVAMTMPLLLWGLYKAWGARRRRIFWGGALLLMFAFLLLSHSRSAILTSLMAVVGVLLALDLRRQLVMLLGGLLLLIPALALNPQLIPKIETHYIYKSGTAETGILFSREAVWKESYRLAKQGGWFGGGYGVTIGETEFKQGLTAVGYGREKGNSQLAIWEETGLVGLFLYSLLIITIITELMLAYRRSRNLNTRTQLAILLGMQCGMFVQSVFEAWWVAPGSPEAAYFWALTGVCLGVIDNTRREVIVRRRARLVSQKVYGDVR